MATNLPPTPRRCSSRYVERPRFEQRVEAAERDPGRLRTTGDEARNRGGGAPSTSGQAEASLATAPILCFGQTDNIHVSGFEVSVHSRTGCNVAGDLTVYLVLDRQRCIWFFCWWSGQATGNSAAFGITSYDAVARAPCKTGYWHAYGSHTALFPTRLERVAQTRGATFHGVELKPE